MYCAFALVGMVGLGVMAMLNGVASADDVKTLINEQRMATKALITAMEAEHRMATKALIAAIGQGHSPSAAETMREGAVAPAPLSSLAAVLPDPSAPAPASY